MTPTSAPTLPSVLPVEQYVATLARKRMAAGVVFRDDAGRVLLVEPSYKPNWEIPGGAVEEREAPWATAQREVAEELGWELPAGRLVVVDYVRPQDSRPEGVIFVFDGGILPESALATARLGGGEILSAGFYSIDEARGRVKPLLADRLTAALAGIAENVTVMCEQGVRIA